ncbi:MAG: GFA family protein [Deltaproteobacteria bacterium]|nr:GFA family protein [Deltaproteobacteria bacterium]
MIEASCHCGAVKLEVATAPTQLTSCNCSICRRLGTLWCYYEPAQVRIIGVTATYRSGDKTLDLHRCVTCGCTTHWSPLDPASNRMGVNARLMDPRVIAEVRVRRLDGADTWKFLD